MYEEYYITLPGGFSLPVALCVEEYTVYEMETVELSQEAAADALSEFAAGYLSGQMVAGNILSKQQVLLAENGLYHLEGEYVCTEMIGRVQREQIGDTNWKSG